MNSLRFTAESSSDGILERDFTVGDVPGILWSPAAATGPAPLVLMGHGGGAAKRHRAMAGRARLLVTGCGFHAAVLDAPGHGDRPRSARDAEDVAALRRAQAAGAPEAPVVVPYNVRLAEQAVPEYRAALDALQELPEIGTGGPVGYVGIGLGMAIGMPLVAAEPRITAAVFGMTWPDALFEAAKRITVPVEFVMHWDSGRIPREASLALFDTFGSAEKSLHANAGEHVAWHPVEADSATRFFARHLAPARP
ncbi:alpha/beta hydrolase [Streptomyces bauhiniae]|uniref:Alpha/beta hydrolase n=1 Tax=Streptomyces bauhiniae TaxID=2340725 RepID=A0A4Z1DBU5_9ACTN|nr:alpha/beta hydrolase [Streptomyces bauhiniae]TGN79520.1 alpha/beta hydrolase [Streptomyces bauhiniae]